MCLPVSSGGSEVHVSEKTSYASTCDVYACGQDPFTMIWVDGYTYRASGEGKSARVRAILEGCASTAEGSGVSAQHTSAWARLGTADASRHSCVRGADGAGG